jgi:hypothetical protein
MEHKIEYVPLSKLQPNPANPKSHNEQLIDKSLSTFGYVDPIVVDERTGFMISGHGRKQVLELMKNEGKEAPLGITENKGEWLVPVVTGWSSKDDTEARAALVALNRTTEQGGWDRENLLTILQELSEVDALDTVGFAETDLLVLERALEAEDVFTMDTSAAIDEFIGDSGIDKERIQMQFSSMLRVYFQTEEARQTFFDAIGYKNVEKQLTIRYPASFQRQDAEQWNG